MSVSYSAYQPSGQLGSKLEHVIITFQKNEIPLFGRAVEVVGWQSIFIVILCTLKQIPVFTKFYTLQVASGREAHIGIAPSSLWPFYGSIIIRKQCHGARFPHLVYSKTFVAPACFVKGDYGVFPYSSAVSYVLQDCPYSVVSKQCFSNQHQQ